MAIDYKTQTVRTAPGGLRDLNGEAFLRAVGDMKDDVVSRCIQAVLARYPVNGYAGREGLDAIGAERTLPRGYTANTMAPESDAVYAARLYDAWNAWKKVGTPLGLLLAFRAIGYPAVRLMAPNGKAYQLVTSSTMTTTTLPDGSWLVDVPNAWSHFDVLFGRDYGALVDGIPTNWTTSPVPIIPAAELERIRYVIRTWAPGYTRCRRIIVVKPGSNVYGWPTGYPWGANTWNHATWGGNVVTTYDP